MPKWISFPKVVGKASRQAHCDLPEGTYEREMSKEGFSGPSAQLYHKHPPTSWLHIEGEMKPRAFDTTKYADSNGSPWNALPLLENGDVHIRIWKMAKGNSDLVRNADGDDLLFFHQGGAELFCDFGHLAINEGDYVLLPRGTLWRVESAEDIQVLMIEARSDSYGLPEKGMLGHHALFDQALLDIPEIDDAFSAQQNENPHEIQVKRGNKISVMHYPFNPLDTVGWHGDLSVVRINWRDIRPVMSHRYHLPPSVHSTFLTREFIVCTFCPRPIESDPGALKVPFFHSNDDYDEVIFYHQGEFFSRDNIHPGMMTFHPSGLPHGPHPKAFSIGAKASRQATDEVAVMVDTRKPLTVCDPAKTYEWEDYVYSWGGKKP